MNNHRGRIAVKARAALLALSTVALLALGACGNDRSTETPATPTAIAPLAPSETVVAAPTEAAPTEAAPTEAVTETTTSTATESAPVTETAALTASAAVTESAAAITATEEVTAAEEVTSTPEVTGTAEVTTTEEITTAPEITTTAEVTATEEVTSTPEVTATTEVTATEEVTSAPEVTVTAEVTATEEVTSSSEVTATAEVTATEEVTSSSEVTATTEVTATEEVTSTPEVTVTAEVTTSEEVTSTPEVTTAAEVRATEETTTTEEITTAPEITTTAEVTATEEVTSTPEVTATAEVTATPELTAAAEMTTGEEITATMTTTPATRPTLAELGGVALMLPNVNAGAAITLTDGIYSRATSTSAAAISATVQLLPIFAAGDLNADGADDVAAIVGVTGAVRNGLYLVALTAQEDGTLRQAAAVLVGSGQVASSLAITDGQISLVLEQMASAESSCCAIAAEERTYRLQDGRLALADVQPVELPYLPGADGARTLEDFPVQMDEITGTVTGELDAGAVHSYLLESSEVQTATITLETPTRTAALAVSLQGAPAALLAARTGATTWTGALPAQAVLVFDVVARAESGTSTPYTLTVALGTAATE